MRLIDASTAIDRVVNRICSDCNNYDGILCRACRVNDCIDTIDCTDTIDPPVKHGHWNLEHCCSKCGRVALSYVREIREVLDYDCVSNGGFEAVVSYYKTDWCPHCGALMDEVSE